MYSTVPIAIEINDKYAKILSFPVIGNLLILLFWESFISSLELLDSSELSSPGVVISPELSLLAKIWSNLASK